MALVEAGLPVLGAIHVPATDCLYLAARGHGARRLDARGETRLVAAPVAHPRRAVVSRSHLSPETGALLARLGVAETIPRGSSLKMCAVAEGAADLYPRLGPTRLWDTAAGTAIAVEAGCDVVGLDGRPLRYDLADGLVRAGFLVLRPRRWPTRPASAPSPPPAPRQRALEWAKPDRRARLLILPGRLAQRPAFDGCFADGSRKSRGL